MSLWSSLLTTYDKCSTAAGVVPLNSDGDPDEKKAFLPLFHTTFKSKICITLDKDGNLIKIEEDQKDVTIIIPCTEKSMSRSSGIAAHPLCDQLEYVDKAMTPDKFKAYIDQLSRWKDDNAKLNAIYAYLSSNSVADALNRDINKEKDRKLGVRFSVQIIGDITPNVWEDSDLRSLWISSNQGDRKRSGIDCFGEELCEIVINHPKNVNSATGNAKLISCNDTINFTFRGRFGKQNEAVQIDSLSSQKVFNTLKWLINNNGYGIDSQVVVIWGVDSNTEAGILPFNNTFDLFGELEKIQTDNDIILQIKADTDLNYATKFINLLKGYGKSDTIKQHNRTIVVSIFDAATTGRMGVTFYREFPENEYLENITTWHADAAWYLTRFEKCIETNNKGKKEEKTKALIYIGCPSFNEIIECIYNPTDKSSNSYKTLAKNVRKQLVECMFGDSSFPFSMVKMATDKISKPHSYTDTSGKWLESKWRRNLEVACSLAKKYYIQKGDDIKMILETKRTDRDYLYGRLLALADNLENYALFKQGNAGSRPTNAVKLWSNFAVKPYTTWGNIWQQLIPYINQLKGAGWIMLQIDEVMELFQNEDFEDNSPLSPLYLLGYSAQHRALNKNKLVETTNDGKGE